MKIMKCCVHRAYQWWWNGQIDYCDFADLNSRCRKSPSTEWPLILKMQKINCNLFLFVELRLSCYFIAAVIFKMACATLCYLNSACFSRNIMATYFFRELVTFAVCLPIPLNVEVNIDHYFFMRRIFLNNPFATSFY